MDQAWFLFLNGLPASAPAVGTLAVVFSTYGPVCYAAILAWLWWRGAAAPDARRRLLLLAVVAGFLSLLVNVGLNLAIPRPRPFLVLPAHILVGSPPHDPSFPSDHAAFTSAIAFTLLLGGMVRWGAVALLGAFAVGASRVIVGVHYPSDVMGGALVGAVCGAVGLQAERPLRPILDLVLAVARRLRLA